MIKGINDRSIRVRLGQGAWGFSYFTLYFLLIVAGLTDSIEFGVFFHDAFGSGPRNEKGDPLWLW